MLELGDAFALARSRRGSGVGGIWGGFLGVRTRVCGFWGGGCF